MSTIDLFNFSIITQTIKIEGLFFLFLELKKIEMCQSANLINFSHEMIKTLVGDLLRKTA